MINQQKSRQDSLTTSIRKLSQVKIKVSLTNGQLLDLAKNDCKTIVINSDKFTDTVSHLQREGVSRLLIQDYEQALIYFTEAERVLDYAANCGKTIDRSLIVTVLHNQACVYQKLQRYQESLTYLQALTYNLNKHLQSYPNINLNPQQPQQLISLSSITSKKKQLLAYHLQFCAMNSQTGNHMTALQAAKKSISIIQQLSFICFNYLKNNKNQDQWVNNLETLSHMEIDVKLSCYQQFLSQAASLVQSLPKTLSSSQKNKFREIQTLPIEKLIELNPISQEKSYFQCNISQECTFSAYLHKVVNLSVAYFSIGNELRFIANNHTSFRKQGEDYIDSEDYRASEIYHLYSIIVLVLYVPCQSLFLEHVLTSYMEIYGIDLRYYRIPNISNLHPPTIISPTKLLPQQFLTTGQYTSPLTNPLLNIQTQKVVPQENQNLYNQNNDHLSRLTPVLKFDPKKLRKSKVQFCHKVKTLYTNKVFTNQKEMTVKQNSVSNGKNKKQVKSVSVRKPELKSRSMFMQNNQQTYLFVKSNSSRALGVPEDNTNLQNRTSKSKQRTQNSQSQMMGKGHQKKNSGASLQFHPRNKIVMNKVKAPYRKQSKEQNKSHSKSKCMNEICKSVAKMKVYPKQLMTAQVKSPTKSRQKCSKDHIKIKTNEKKMKSFTSN